MGNQNELINNIILTGESSPLTFIDGWDFFLVIMAVLVRMFFAMKYKAAKLVDKDLSFTFKEYFDAKHLIRWGGHLITALTLILVVPEFFLSYVGPKYFPDYLIGHLLAILL